jgi:hypothetical protein
VSSLIPQQYLWMVAAGAVLLAVIALIFVFSLMASLRRLRKQNKRWKSIHSSADLEAVYESTVLAVKKMESELEHLQSQVVGLKQALQSKVTTPRLIRYNGFGESGNDLSYSVAFLDDANNGVVLSSIYGREESHTYGKPIEAGQSPYTLTAEEQKVIRAKEQSRHNE